MAGLGTPLEPPEDGDVSALVPGPSPEDDADERDDDRSLQELIEDITETPDGVDID